MPTIPIPRLNDFEAGDVGSNEFLDRLTKLSRSLEYIMNHMDHANVRQLYTEYCNIQSKAGETEIDGPTLIQKASGSTTIRLKMGWEPSSTSFVFKIWNAAGSTMIELDSSGGVVFMGTLRSGSTTGQRIEIKDQNFFMYNSSNQLEGLVFGSTFGTWGDVFLYNDGVKVAQTYFDPNITWFRPGSTNYGVGLGRAETYTYLAGYVSHGGTAAKLGLFDTAPVAKTAVAANATTTINGLQSKVNELISALNSYGIV